MPKRPVGKTTKTQKKTSKTHTTAGVRPVLYASRPAAGFPAPGDDLIESQLSIDELLIDHPVSTFFVRVEGDSLIGTGILSGDVLVVDRSREAVNGAIVVASVYGELVVKRLKKYKNRIELVSENPTYEPISITGEDDCLIWGVVTGVVRKLVV